ncbi:two-CW domain-containing protein [Thermodesulfobacteriota bacterium]
MTKKKNCWEFKKCGREPEGRMVHHLGVCSAAQETKLDGVHDGKNAGRSCWVVAGTFCGGKVQGLFAAKYDTCKECDFYKKVMEENFDNFQVTLTLMKKLKE